MDRIHIIQSSNKYFVVKKGDKRSTKNFSQSELAFLWAVNNTKGKIVVHNKDATIKFVYER